MSRNRLQSAVDDFVQVIVGLAEDTAQSTLAARAKELRTVRHSGRKPMRAKAKPAKAKGTRAKSMSKPCPFPECENTGAPRLGMMCPDHKNISKERKNTLRYKAKQPGGKWNPKAGGKKSAAKRTKKKPAAKKSAKKPAAKKSAKKSAAKKSATSSKAATA